MSKTKYYVASSIDGFIADERDGLDWLFQFDDPAVTAHHARFLEGIGALAMGARTYEFVVRSGDAWPYASLPTWIFTHRTLPKIPGANLVFTDEAPERVHASIVAAAAGRDLWLVGGGDLVSQFAARGLLDELDVAVVPVLLGKGAPLLPIRHTRPIALLGSAPIGDKGIVELRYAL
jgi:dihydrofolate reductase